MYKTIAIISFVFFIKTIDINAQWFPAGGLEPPVERSPTGEILNQLMNVRYTVIQEIDSVATKVVYIEGHSARLPASKYPQFALGAGRKLMGDFEILDWKNNSYFILVEVDKTGYEIFTEVGYHRLNFPMLDIRY